MSEHLDCGVPVEGARTVTPGEGFDSPRHPKPTTIADAMDQWKRDVYLHKPVACAVGRHRWVENKCVRCGAERIGGDR